MANISNYSVGIQNDELDEKYFNNFADMCCYLFVTERLNLRNGKRVGKWLPFVGGTFNLDKPTLSELENNNIKAYKKRMLKMFHEHFDR